MTDVEKTCEKEITELHKFFTDWYKGTIDKTDKKFSRFNEVLHKNFSLITPTGEKISRDRILSLVKKSYGINKNMEPPFHIWIENFNLEYKDKEIILATYEEWQKNNGKTTGRISSVLFQQKEEKPNNLVWVHVHETWLPGKNPSES